MIVHFPDYKVVASFLNSSLFLAIVTIFVGCFAIYIYMRQKKDFKKDAANSMLLEIQSAESAITKVRENLRSGKLEIDVTVLQSNGWSQYKHLFSRSFDKDEWDLVDNFYNKAALLEKTIENYRASFGNDVEQIRANKQRILADCALEIVNNSKPKQKAEDALKSFNEKVDFFNKLYMGKQGEFAYRPQKYIDDTGIYLEDLQRITTSSAGEKLKKIAGVNKK